MNNIINNLEKYKYDLINDILCINGDCLDVMQDIQENSIDCILTDPPYFQIVKNSWDNQWNTMNDFQLFIDKLGQIFLKLLKDNGSFYWFGDDKNIAYCQVVLDKYFNLLNNIVWHKIRSLPHIGTSGYRSYAPITERILFYEKNEVDKNFNNKDEKIRQHIYKSCIEYMRNEKKRIKEDFNLSEKDFNNIINKITNTSSICRKHYFDFNQWCFPTKEKYNKIRDYFNNEYFKKEYEDFKKEYEDFKKEYEDLRRVWNNDSYAMDVLEYSSCFEKNRFHPTQKPLNIIQYIIERSTNINNIVLDCFAGSGTIGVACLKSKRKCILIEKDEDYYNKMVSRIRKESEQGVLI